MFKIIRQTKLYYVNFLFSTSASVQPKKTCDKSAILGAKDSMEIQSSTKLVMSTNHCLKYVTKMYFGDINGLIISLKIDISVYIQQMCNKS